MPVADAPITAAADFFRDEPYVVHFRIRAPNYTARLNDAALVGATSLTVLPLPRALTAGYKLYFALTPTSGVLVKVSGSAAVGSTSVPVVALTGPIPGGVEGVRILDAASLTLSWTLEKKQPLAISPVLLTKVPTTTADPADPDGTPFTLAVVSKAATDIATASPGVYVQRLVRTDTGRCLAQGDVTVKVR